LKIKNINIVEAYDIANIQGKYAYGSMVVFIDGSPQKDLYRIFKIKSVSGANDVAMLKEVISRRLKHKEWEYPDVILVDGGKAQMNAVLDPITLPPAPKIIALTKNRRHHGDHIYISDKKSPTPLNTLPLPLKNLLLNLDSEAHRFAIKHYRQAHKKMLSSN
jgi:excinuclease ABC subunit C